MNGLISGLFLGWGSLAIGLAVYFGIRKWLRKRRYGESIDHGLLLVEYGRKLTNIKDQPTLVRLLEEEIPNKLQIDQVQLLLPDGHNISSTNDADLRLPVSHAAVRWVASSGEAQLADHGQLQKLIQQGRMDLSWTRVWVPLMRGTKLRGMWLLGKRSGNIRFSPEDLRWMTSIAREVAAVLEAMDFAKQERDTAEEMRALYRQVVMAREAERTHLTRELHDGVLQDLCAVARDLKALDTHSEETVFSELVNLSGETVNALRAICNDLRPPLLQHDLVVALKALVQEIDTRSAAPVHIEVQVDDVKLPDEIALAIFRITQEALHNAIQHADASEIAVRLTQYPDRLRLTVTDDGKGITGSTESVDFVADGHFGLAGMRERATMVGGKLDLQTALDYGTVVILELPHSSFLSRPGNVST
jgi:signal transduction histidine kinase